MRSTLVAILIFCFIPAKPVGITESTYEGTPHYVVRTNTATWWYDRPGGGISRMIDRQGRDWIAFKREPWNKTPGSAASSYRGIPNAVYQGEDGGCGHPGFDKCVSCFEPPNIIRTKSISGKWEWTWTFFEDHAVWEVVKTDTSRRYWFLYEGPAGGSFVPEKSCWQNSSSTSVLRDMPDHMKGERITGNWKWAVFGRDDVKSRLFLIHQTYDNETDTFSYMGSTVDGIGSDDGMTVFGFGRTADSQPLLTGNHKFVIGFYYRNNNKKFIKLRSNSVPTQYNPV